jgi:RNA 3'-terminal phosphate cyclase (ATP)
MIVIDGSQGEGGGQVLRTSLSLSALTGRSVRLINIRAGRSRPGLRPQHLSAVRAVAAICAAEVAGDRLDSRTLEFSPGSPPIGGDYTVDVTEASRGGRSAGAVTLILQALLWPLIFAEAPSRLTLRGGTFVPFSPPFHYLDEVARPAFERLGATFSLQLRAWGWMSEGGGEITAVIEPQDRLAGVHFLPGGERHVWGVAAVTNLPSHIPHRMARRAHNLLIERDLEPEVQALRESGAGPGAGDRYVDGTGRGQQPGRQRAAGR